MDGRKCSTWLILCPPGERLTWNIISPLRPDYISQFLNITKAHMDRRRHTNLPYAKVTQPTLSESALICKPTVFDCSIKECLRALLLSVRGRKWRFKRPNFCLYWLKKAFLLPSPFTALLSLPDAFFIHCCVTNASSWLGNWRFHSVILCESHIQLHDCSALWNFTGSYCLFFNAML